MNYGSFAPSYNPNQNSLYNPYDEFNNLTNQTVMPYPNQNPILPPSQQPTIIIPPPIILANTYLPRSYYEDIIDNLELITLNMINDLQALQKNQRQMKVNRFDPSFLINLKSSIKEQFTEVEEYREKEKYKLLEEFKTAQNDIAEFLKEKYKPGQVIMQNFSNELKKDKRALNESLRGIEETVKREHNEVEKILCNLNDPFIKHSAQIVFKPRTQSDLDLAMFLKQRYGTKEENEEIKKDLKKKKYPKSTYNIEQEIINIKNNLPEEEERDDDDEEIIKEKKDTREEDLKRKQLLVKKMRKAANVHCAIQKMIIARKLKLYYRIRNFSDLLLHVEEYIDSMIEYIFAKPIENVAKYKQKLDLDNKIQLNKVYEFLKNFIESLMEKTTIVRINRTFSFFFRRYIFDLDVVPPQYFTLYERRRIKYAKGEDLTKQQQQMVLLIKVIISSLVNEILLEKIDSEDPVIAFNFRLLASIFYYMIINYFQTLLPLLPEEFDNSSAIKRNSPMDFSKIEDENYKEKLENLQLFLEEETKEICSIQKENVNNITIYKNDVDTEEINEIFFSIFPDNEILQCLENDNIIPLLTELIQWSEKVIELMNSHQFTFQD